MTEFRTSNSMIAPLLQQHATANAPPHTGASGLLPSLTPWAQWLRQRGHLMTSLLQVIGRLLVSNVGRQAAR
jgi:hypothetical protein